ncbi:MAG: hypothetical protein NTZ72_16020, partial [Afipia sp.]|nr:hypothetical protein [Afipia sp.]
MARLKMTAELSNRLVGARLDVAYSRPWYFERITYEGGFYEILFWICGVFIGEFDLRYGFCGRIDDFLDERRALRKTDLSVFRSGKAVRVTLIGGARIRTRLS